MSTAELPPPVVKSAPAAKKNPNALLIAFRKYHTWLGVGFTAFIATIAVTGIYLNHKATFNAAFPFLAKPEHEKEHGERRRMEGEKKPEPKPIAAATTGNGIAFTTTTDLSAIPVSMTEALAIAKDRFGDVPLERIELKNDKGSLVYRVKTAGGELVIDAGSGAVGSPGKPQVGPRGKEREKPEGERAARPEKPAPSVMTADEYEEKQNAAGKTDWGKIIKDVHTGKIGGLVGKLTADGTALVLTSLCATGVYLWVVPLLRKRRSAKLRAAADAARI